MQHFTNLKNFVVRKN